MSSLSHTKHNLFFNSNHGSPIGLRYAVVNNKIMVFFICQLCGFLSRWFMHNYVSSSSTGLVNNSSHGMHLRHVFEGVLMR